MHKNPPEMAGFVFSDRPGGNMDCAVAADFTISNRSVYPWIREHL
jgi:hypothetical protein